MTVVENAIEELFCNSLSLLHEEESTKSTMRSYRDLYQLPLHAFHDKCALLHAAESSGCSAVILDVLLFVSETMTPSCFYKQLTTLPLSLHQWSYYLLEQCMIANETISLGALRELIDLFTATQRYRELAAMISSLIFTNREFQTSLKLVDDVLEIINSSRHRFPLWILDLLHEYVTLSKLQIQTEHEDAKTAPEGCTKGTKMDKRSRGAGNLQANWRMRYVHMTEKEIVYYKHEKGKREKMKIKFHQITEKNNKKGHLALAKGMHVEPLDYRGKFSLRPWCVKICDAAGSEELILDVFTPEAQRQWISAITANIKRLELDPRWRAFPRKCVHRMTVSEFLRYAMLYHGDANKLHTINSSCQPGTLRTQFNIDAKRYLFSALLTCALVRDWKTMEALVQPRSAKSAIMALFSGGNSYDLLTPTSSIARNVTTTPAPSRYSTWSNSTTDSVSSYNNRLSTSSSATHSPSPKVNTVVQGMADASAIGYGAILDIAEQQNAPPNLLMLLESLHEKNDSKRGKSAGWTCRRDVDASDAASMKILIDIPDSVRVSTNWE